MMKLIKVLVILCMVSFIFSCSDELVTDEIIEIQDATDVLICGYDHQASSRQEQITTVPLFNPCDALNLFVLVDLSECASDDIELYECAIDNSIASYNALPESTGIGMTMITDESELPPGEAVNITIDCEEIFHFFLGIPLLGSAARRSTPEDISVIKIHDDITNIFPVQPGPDCCQLQKTVMHELGHALGLGHTQGGTGSAQHIPGTPMGEANSIMNSSSIDNYMGGCEFTPGDLLALDILYGDRPCIACPDGPTAPEVEIVCNERGLPCLMVDGTFNYDYPSAPYDICPPNTSCFLPDQAGETISFIFCEWGPDSDCETGEGCCWEYDLVVPTCDDCPSGATPPEVEIVCNEDSLPCLMINGVFSYDYPSAPYDICPPNRSCFKPLAAGRTISFTFCEWGTNSDCETGEGCCWEYDLAIPDCTGFGGPIR